MILRIRIRFKSGFELPITCEEFSITKSALDGEVMAYDIKGIKDNKPLFIRWENVECVFREVVNDETD